MTDKRPNILLITTDQQRFDTIAAHGNGYIDTPHLDWLSDEGISYARAYADCPICMPSRATIMTGKAGYALGLTGNSNADFPLARETTLPALLGAAGYQTRAQGKMHFHPVRAHYGFQTMELPMDYYRERHRLSVGDASLPKEHGVGENEMQAVISTVHENDSLTHWTVRRSIDFLETRDSTRPFFLWTSFTKPHPPFDPPANYWALYANRTMPAPVIGDWSADAETMPTGMLEPTWLLNNVQRMSAEQLANSRRAYYACITHIDYTLGLLFARMREMELLENTWIIFTSDHGENLGDHRMGAKSNFMEGSAHIPMIVRPPAAAWEPNPLAGRRVDTLVSLADVMPTILGIAGVAADSIPRDMTGTDMLRLVENADGEREFFGESGRFLCVVSGTMKYHYCVAGGAELLFDLETDPHEQHDLSTSADYATHRDRLRGKLTAHLSARGSRFVRDGALVAEPAPAGPADVGRWPGFHSTVFESDVLH
jgi:arylsulfatase